MRFYSRQEAKSHGQSLQEAIYQAQQSRQEARARGQSRRKPNMTDSLCSKRKLADLFIPCVTGDTSNDNHSPGPVVGGGGLVPSPYKRSKLSN